MPGKAVLIAGSATEASVSMGGTSRACARTFQGPRTQEGVTERGNLAGTVKDVILWERFCQSGGISIHQSFKRPGTGTKKSEVLGAIESLLEQEADFHFIGFAGHGEEFTGNWCFENEAGEVDSYITRDDIIGLLRESMLHGKWGRCPLIIYADCCFSGNWCHLEGMNPAGEHDNEGFLVRNDYFMQRVAIGNDVLPGFCPIPCIRIQASCDTDETATETAAGGFFTQTMFQLTMTFAMTSAARVENYDTLVPHVQKTVRDSFAEAGVSSPLSNPSRQHPQSAVSVAVYRGTGRYTVGSGRYTHAGKCMIMECSCNRNEVTPMGPGLTCDKFGMRLKGGYERKTCDKCSRAIFPLVCIDRA